MEQLIQLLVQIHPAVPIVLTVLGTLVVIGQTYVLMTPTQDDDKWFAKLETVPVVGQLLSALKSFAPVQRKSVKEKQE